MAVKDGVSLKINTDAKTTEKTLNDVIKQLGNVNDKLDRISSNNGFKNVNNDVLKTSKLLSSTKATLSKVNSGMKLTNLALLGTAFSRIGKTMSSFIDDSSSYVENLNLMQVAFADTRDEAESFVNGLSDIFGLDESQMTRQLGFYRQIGNALAIGNNYADLLAKNLLKMQLDMSSLYNLSFEKSGEVLQSSMAGQTKPIRGATGGDITQGTLQTDLDRLGINRAITDLSRAEKSILIYLSLERQLTNSQGDLAKTINSTANQQKIFSEQTQRLSRAMGNVLTPAMTKVLYVANGLLMVFVELVEMFAKFVGFEIPEYDASSYGGLEDISDYLTDIEDGANKASKALLGLRSFDKLNNITTPKSSGTGSGGLGGVDQRLLDALSEYDLKLSGIDNIATKIRDKIMKWLGFTKEVNAETGEITWKYDTLGKTAEQIATEVGTNLGKNLTYFTNTINYEKIGRNLAKGLNISLNFLNAFIDNYSWINLGNKLANGVNSAVENINWFNVGKFLTSKFKIMIETLYGFVSKLNWANFGKVIGNGINGALSNINLTMIAKTMNKITEGIFKSLVNAIKTINWGKAFDDIVNGFKELNVVGKAFVGLGIASAITKIMTAVKGSTLIKGINNLLTPLKNLVEYTKVYINLAKKDGVTGIKAFGESLKGATAEIGTMNTMLIGGTGLIFGLTGVRDGMKSISEEGAGFGNTLETIGGGLSTIASSALIGNQLFPTYGLLIGGIAGAIGTLATSLISYKENAKESAKETKDYEESLKRLDETTRTKLTTDLAVHDNNIKLTDELGKLVDANGKVKKSDEDRVNYILNELNNAYQTNYKLIDGKITKDGKEVKSIKGVQDAIKEKIKWMKLEAVQEAYKEDYLQLIKNEKTLTEESTKAHENYKNMQQKIIDKYGERDLALYEHGLLDDEVKKQEIENDMNVLKSNKDVMDGIDSRLNETKKGMENYQKFSSAILNEDYETALKLGGNYYNNSEDLQNYYAKKTEENSKNVKSYLDNIFKSLPEKKKVEISANVGGFMTTVQNTLSKFNNKTVNVDANTSKLSTKLTDAFKNTFANFGVSGIIAKITGHAKGSYDVPEDGWFRASKGEFFGQFDDGTSYIANNKQITEGLRSEFRNAMMDALVSTNSGQQDVNVTIVAEDNGILNAIKFKEKDRERQYGY